MYSLDNIKLNDSKIPQNSTFKHVFINKVDESQDTYLNGKNLSHFNLKMSNSFRSKLYPNKK